MDLSFLEKTLESCLKQSFEITRLFDYLDGIIKTSSQQRRFETFTDKWKVLHQNSKNMNMMIVNCTETFIPTCLSRVELSKQTPWETFVQQYSPTYSESTLKSNDQPLNFKELVQLPFWKAVYEAFGHRIVTHIFEKCALLFEVDEGFYIIVAYSKGLMHCQIKAYQEAVALPDNRITLPQYKSKNSYQLSAPVVKPNHPLQEHEVAVVEKATSNELVEYRDHEDMEVCENLPDAPMELEGNHETEPPKKRLKLDKDTGLLEEMKSRWKTLKPKELQKLIEHRRNFYKIKTTETPPSSQCELNYVLLQKNEDFEPTDKMAVIKQCCPIRVAAPRLPTVWKGLRLPEDLKNIAGNNKKVNCTVYTISETLALQLRIRIKPQKHCRKRKHVTAVMEGITASQSIHNCSNNGNEQAVVLYVPVEGQKDNNGSKESANMGQETELDTYVPETTLSIVSCLYNKSAWTKWPESHSLFKAAEVLPVSESDAVIKLIQNIVNSKTCSKKAQDRLVNRLGDLEQDIVFQRLVKSIIQTHMKKNSHKLLKSCLFYWRSKYYQKQQKRSGARSKVSAEKIPDKINEKRRSRENREMSESKNQLELEMIDLTTLTNTSSTNFSLPDKIRVLEEWEQKPEVMEVGKFNKTINSLKNNIPHNCVMQTLKQIFHIMKMDSLLGSQRNKRGFFKFVRKAVILGGMKSALHLGQLMATLHVEDMPLTNVCGNDKVVAEVFAAKVVAWLFNEYILVILKRSFYITECSTSRLQLQFYLKETWISASSKMKKQLHQKGVLMPQQGFETGKTNVLLRYVPKSNQTLRPLLIMKKEERKLHAADTEVFKIMLHYIDAKINKARMCVPSTIRRVWKNFVTEWKLMGCPKLFYFRTDIRDAYPSVSISKLKEILLKAGGENGHQMVLKQFIVIGAGGRKRVRTSIFDGSFRDNWHSGIHSRPCLVMDLERDRIENASNILERVINVLGQSNVVKIGRRFYEFSHGLPQGWGPSSILCSIYYGYIDSEMYLPFIEPSGRLFLRIVDDYLFITPSPIDILNLNQHMKFGCEKYKVELNEEKSESNMFVRSNIPIPSRNCDTVTFCGWNFCLTCAHVSRDYKKYDGQDLCSTVAFQLTERVESPEHFIRQRGTVIVSARVKPIVIDPTINCPKRILLTTFEASTFLSFRFYAICRVVYPSLSAIKEPERAKSVAISIKICCGRLAGYISRNCEMLSSFSMSAQQEVELCSEGCCGKQFSNQGACESQKPAGPSPSSNLVLHHDSLLYTSLIGFRIMLRKHHEVFKEVIPQINKRISDLQRKLGSDRATTILSVIDDGKIPQCFQGISIKM